MRGKAGRTHDMTLELAGQRDADAILRYTVKPQRHRRIKTLFETI